MPRKQELTTQDICRMWNVTKMTVLNWRRRGMPFYRLSGNSPKHRPVRYDRKAVIKWCEENGKGGPGQ